MHAKPLSNPKVANKTLIFLHIHKTAGTTLTPIVQRQFSTDEVFPDSLSVHLSRRTLRILWGKRNTMVQIMEEFDGLSDEAKKRIKLLHSHIPYGIHADMPQPCVYFTMLRDPVKRMISQYYHLKRHPNLALHNKVKNMSLTEYVKSGLDEEIPQGNNAQVRRITGLHPDEPLTPKILKLAKKIIREQFVFVGLTERFNESLLLLGQIMGWKRQNLLYFNRNVNQNKKTKKNISPDVLALIEEYNQPDIELYKFAVAAFDQMITVQGEIFQEDLHSFEQELEAYQRNPRVVAHSYIYDTALKLHHRFQAWIRRDELMASS